MPALACTTVRRVRIIEGIAVLDLLGRRSQPMQQERKPLQPRHETVFVGSMLERLLAHEPEAVRIFIHSFTPALVSIISTQFHSATNLSPDERSEYLQDCFGKIFEKLPTFDTTKGVRLETWAWTVATNLMRDEWRRRCSRKYDFETSIDEQLDKYGRTLAAPESAEPEQALLDTSLGLEAALQTIAEKQPRWARDCQILLLELDMQRKQVKPTVKILAEQLDCDPSTITRIKQRWTRNGFLDYLSTYLKTSGVLS